MEVNYQELLKIYDYEISKTCKNKKKIYNFEINKMQNIANIKTILENNTYYPSKYNIFFIRDPKYRIVMSSSISDKIVNHYLAKNVLVKKLDKYFDIRSVATRKNYGSDYGIKLLKRYIEYYKKYNNFYILKIDIKKYFYNIDHDVLKSMLINRLNSDEYDIITRIIDATNNKYINEDINNQKNINIKKHPLDKDKIMEIPLYKHNKGLSLGAVISQYLSVYYLTGLIHYIIHDLHLKHLIHYVDDIVILYNDKEYLKECFIKIEKYINNILKLEINNKKTSIVSIKDGFTFLGYKYRVINNKTIINIKKSTIEKVNRHIKRNIYLFNKDINNYKLLFSSINTYLYSFKYGNNFKIVKIVNKNWGRLHN